jgi:quinol monooxygenase YgiN
MRSTFILLLGLTISSAASLPAAMAQEAAIYVTTYIDVVPQSMEAAVAALKSEAAASRKDDGNREAQVLREIGRSDRFVVLETWMDKRAFAAHGKAPHVQQFRDQIKAIEAAPPDERVLATVWSNSTLEPKSTPISAPAVWVATHVDVMPDYEKDAALMLKTLGEASVKETGNLRFLAAHQPDRPNHFTLGEIWADRASFDAHQAAAPTRQFRDRLGPMLGALYDQRIYQAVD